MDLEYLVIGLIFLLYGVAVFVYKFRYHIIDKDLNYSTYSNKRVNSKLLVGDFALILFAIHLIWKEIEILI
jgi:hypothetical protein